ncbi:urea ABC transporter permease subunit UrtB [Frigidibacter oleivorans]|uniref:urea ABC transporter permease subunit UrtB n=1 Tax=Frigidibacter oleivorans TaxID=2487129 RepID=UPI000F8D71DE|nr:urea ABC transporter permease subunit UrtB [Frigidibacter oleivorans]
MTFFRAAFAATILALIQILATAATAQDFAGLVRTLPEGSYSDRAAVVAAIATSGDARAEPVLAALLEGELGVVEATGQVIVQGSPPTDAVTGDEVDAATADAAERIRVNNSLRRDIRAAIGLLTLSSPDPAKRMAAAEAAIRAPDPDQIAALETAIAAEEDGRVRTRLGEARAIAVLASDAGTEARIAAIDTLARRGDQVAQSAIAPLAGAEDPALAEAATRALAAIEQSRMLWGYAQNIWYGLSLGSVLLLAAIGLAITFGVMGVINMAHGELVMLGAYTTFVVQDAIRSHAPGLFDWSLLIAAPLAFLVAGGIGVAIERGIVRHLYGRALETLLATWGVSLILQQAVRSIFGPNNREVGNPSWMSGSFDVGQMTVTWNRLWILLFALAVFAVLLAVMKRTPAGLQMRAVTQNRPMAANMGIRTAWVDAMTFGLGAGIAGLAGVALSQIDNVSPNLGQGYIVDSFMVVVFGGAGNIWGTLAGAFSLGIVNKFLEPYAGAVLGKILVLVAIILFIQKRPRGLFAVKGRAVEG